jgi:hypothetical protein
MGRLGQIDTAPAAQPEANSLALQHCRVWLKWAAAQVEECLTRDALASADLLRALAEVLGSERREMSAVVIAVQSHDRVTQGLAHVAESLHALHALLGDARHANSSDAWRMLRGSQYRAFSMVQERALFARMVAPEDELGHEAPLTADETVELFTGDHGLVEP